jgi:hypothetical protein
MHAASRSSQRLLAEQETRRTPANASPNHFDPSQTWATQGVSPIVWTASLAWPRPPGTINAQDAWAARRNGCARPGGAGLPGRTFHSPPFRNPNEKRDAR